MPNLIIPVDNTYECVTRNVVKSVMDRLIKLTGLSTDVPIRLPGVNGTIFQTGSTVSKDIDSNVFEHSGKVTVQVREEYREDALLRGSVRHPDQRSIFEFKPLKTLLKPVYSYTDVTLDIQYRAPTRSEVERWRDDIKVRIADNRQAHLHDLKYHYAVPKLALIVLHHLHTLKEAQAGYGDTFVEWLRTNFTRKATSLTNLNGQQALLVIGERQQGVQGWFDFDTPPEPEKDDGGASWTVTFSYRFGYQKPVSTVLEYPQVVHNQLIDPEFMSEHPPFKLNRDQVSGSYSREAFDVLEDLDAPPDPMGGLRIPDFDDWIPQLVPVNTETLINFMIQVVPGNECMVMDLRNDESVEFFPEILAYMEETREGLCTRGQSLLHFTLFKGSMPLDPESIYVDEDMVIRTAVPMDIRCTYHLRLSAVVNRGLINKPAQEVLLRHGKATLLIFQSLANDLDVEAGRQMLVDETYMTVPYYDWFMGVAMDRHVSPRNPRRSGLEGALVMQLTIATERKE